MALKWEDGALDWIIFDCDGVILHTEDIYTDIGHQVISKYSKLTDPSAKIIDAELKIGLMGRKKKECAQIMIDRYQLDIHIDDYIQETYAMEIEAFRCCPKMPGAKEIIEALGRTGAPLAVATGSSGHIFQIKRTNHTDIFTIFKAIVVGDDPAVVKGKPDPDIFLEAARLIDVKSVDRCLVIEDSPNGVKAGLAAGMWVAWVPDPYLNVMTSCPELCSHPRVRIFDSLDHLHRCIFPSSNN